PENALDAVIFLERQAMLLDEFRCDGGIGHQMLFSSGSSKSVTSPRRPVRSSGFRERFALQRANQALENQTSIGASQQRLAGPLRMRHKAADIAAFVADTGDVVQRAVRIRVVRQFAGRAHVAPQDLVVRLQPRDGFGVSKITALAMRDWDSQQLAVGNRAGERRVFGDRLEKNVLAAELERTISYQGSRQQAGL